MILLRQLAYMGRYVIFLFDLKMLFHMDNLNKLQLNVAETSGEFVIVLLVQ